MYQRAVRTLTCFLLLSQTILSETSEDDLLRNVQDGFNEYLHSGERPAYLNEALSNLQLPNLFRDNTRVGSTMMIEQHKLGDSSVCTLCNILASFFFNERKLGATPIQLKAEAISVCMLLNIENERVCTGVVELNANILIYIIDNYNIPAGKICDLLLQQYNCNLTSIEWTIDIPAGESISRDLQFNSDSTYNILHVTDVHMDLMYTQNISKSCSEPVCCQSDQDKASVDNDSCGYWAEYGSDVSEHLVDEFIRFANTFDLDFVYFTGDIVSHRIWDTTENGNTEVIKQFMSKLKSGFKVPVYPSLGNHEPNPLNQYAYDSNILSNMSTTWLYNLIEQNWSEWLPNSTIDTIVKGGFYTLSPMDGFRIIVLNNNVAYKTCWWLLQQDKDPYDQLDWLVSILSQAEANGESVHILGHIPTGSGSITKVWSREYSKIVSRFANTITGQFNGHVHVDTFNVFYNTSNNDQAVNVAWNGASLVPYDYANPSFKVYKVDKETFTIVDIDQYTFDLEVANQNPDKYPEWYKIYSFRDAFKLSSLEPDNVDKLLIDMATNHTLLGEYHLYRYKNSEYAQEFGCDQTCQKGYLCELSTSFMGDSTKCTYLEKLYDENT